MCAARTQEEGLRRVQELKAEINSLEESRQTEAVAYEKLKEEHSALAKQLEEEKVIKTKCRWCLQWNWLLFWVQLQFISIAVARLAQEVCGLKSLLMATGLVYEPIPIFEL